MFLGGFEHAIDDKGRLTVPAKFREELLSGIVITRGLDGCLWAYTRSEWEVLVSKIANLSAASRPTRNFSRFIFSDAFDSIPDRQGRVFIPQELRDYANIKNETVIIGVMNRIEIWDPAKWAEIVKEIESDPESMVSQLPDLEI